jgi:hypothetical protein
MNQRSCKNHSAKSWNPLYFEEEEDYKDIYFPDDLTGEVFLQVHAKWAFEAAGYCIQRAAKAETHPIFIIRLIRATAPKIEHEAQLFQHVRQLLREHCITIHRYDLSVSRTGDRILVAFPMKPFVSRNCKQKRAK